MAQGAPKVNDSLLEHMVGGKKEEVCSEHGRCGVKGFNSSIITSKDEGGKGFNCGNCGCIVNVETSRLCRDTLYLTG